MLKCRGYLVLANGITTLWNINNRFACGGCRLYRVCLYRFFVCFSIVLIITLLFQLYLSNFYLANLQPPHCANVWHMKNVVRIVQNIEYTHTRKHKYM